MRTLRIVLAAGAVMGLLSGCGPQDETVTSPSEGRLFGVSFQTMNNPFFGDCTKVTGD